MDVSCNVIGDLLPLYAEDIAAPDTKALVEEHLNTCPRCRERLAQMKSTPPLPEAPPDGGLKELRHRIFWPRWAAALLLTVAAAAFAGFLLWDRPVCLTAEQAVASVTEVDGVVTVNFTDQVTGHWFSMENGEAVIYAEASPFRHGGKAPPFTFGAGQVARVWYAAADLPNASDTLLWGPETDYGQTTLPRLAMYYYFLLALVMGAALAIGAVFLRKRKVGVFLAAGAALLGCFAAADMICTYGQFVTQKMPEILLPTAILTFLLAGAVWSWWSVAVMYRRK